MEGDSFLALPGAPFALIRLFRLQTAACTATAKKRKLLRDLPTPGSGCLNLSLEFCPQLVGTIALGARTAEVSLFQCPVQTRWIQPCLL